MIEKDKKVHTQDNRVFTTTKQQMADKENSPNTRTRKPAPKQSRHNSRPPARSNRHHSGTKSQPFHRAKPTAQIPPIEDGAVRVIPLGGVEEVGKNMIVVENKDDIFIFDVGFQFSDNTTPGIDYILPNTEYLENNKHKVRAVIITHGHLDHIGGIPHIMERIGNPPLYSREFTTLMIKKRQEEHPQLKPLDIHIVEPGQRMKIGSTMVQFFPVTHSIPDSMGVIIETSQGNVVVSGDLRLEHNDGIPSEKEEENWGKIGKQNNLIFIADSTNAENPGFSISDSTIFANLDRIIKDADGRLIIGTFASQVERMIKIIEICEKYNKKVITEGRSIKTNIEIAKVAKLIHAKKDTFISMKEVGDYPADRIVVFATGGQGEEFAALPRMGRGDHKAIKLNSRDTIVLSSSVIPGNEVNVQKLKDILYRHGLKIIHYRVSDIHASGHANQEELLWMNKKVGARFFMPAYGFHSMLRVHAETAIRAGVPKENIIIPDNGTIIELKDEGKKMIRLKEKAPSNLVIVDGFSVGNIQEAVIRDRQTLAQDGMFVVIAIVDMKTGKVRKSPDIISRGFVYLRESQSLLQQARYIVKNTIENSANKRGRGAINFDDLKKEISDKVSEYLMQQTAKDPIVLPVLIGV